MKVLSPPHLLFVVFCCTSWSAGFLPAQTSPKGAFKIESSTGAREPVAARDEFTAFWNRFKSAVASSDKAAVSELTNFPFSMYQSDIKNRADFLRRYNEIFKGEANAAQCFSRTEPQKESARRYEIYCPFKNT